jgi:hypothetical protein
MTLYSVQKILLFSNELEHNNNFVDKIVYCQEVLGHKKGLGSLKATLSYQRFVLV